MHFRHALAGLMVLGSLPLGACAADDEAAPSSPATSAAGSGGGGAGGPVGVGGASYEGGAGGAGGTAEAGGAPTSVNTGGAGGVTTSAPSNYDCSPPVGAAPALKLTPFVTGLTLPMQVKTVPGDDSRFYIVQQDGRIVLLKDGVVLPAPFLDISNISHAPANYDERGLLALAFHPDYANNGRFFIYYTDGSGNPGDQVLAEYRRSDSDPDVADPVAVQVLRTFPDTEFNHNGASLEFSPTNGFLYISLGDGGGAGDQHGAFGNGQNLSAYSGKILRIDVSTTPYAIPSGNMTDVPEGNPTTGDVLPEIWDYGLRNAWRMTFDQCTGDLYIGDVGQDHWEEVDVEPNGQGRRNYGWRVQEGTHCFNPSSGCDVSGITPPVVEYSHNEGCSITGGYVYRGTAIPSLRGSYFYGDWCQGNIWSFVYAGGQAQNLVKWTEDLQSPGIALSSFGQDNHGELYVVDLMGSIYRLDAE